MGFITNVNVIAANIDDLVALAANIDDLTLTDEQVAAVVSVHDNIATILLVEGRANDVAVKHEEVVEDAADVAAALATVLSKAATIDGQATTVDTKHGEVVTIRNEIYNLTGRALLLNEGEPMYVTYNPANGELLVAVPKGDKGDKGDPFDPDILALEADKSNYDSAPYKTSFLAIDTGNLYFKLSDALADWSDAIPFGAYVGVIHDDTTWSVGPTGHFTTLQSVLNAAQAKQVLSPATLTIELQAGYVISEGVTIAGADFTNVKITSVDPEVNSDEVYTGYVLTMDNCSGLTFSILVNALNSCKGISINDRSSISIDENSGVKNSKSSGGYGLRIDGASTGYVGDGATFDYSQTGIYVDGGSTVNIAGASIDQCGLGMWLDGASHAIINDSSIDGGAVNNIVVAGGSEVYLGGTSVKDALIQSVHLDDGRLHAYSCDFSGSNGASVEATKGSNVHLNDCEARKTVGSDSASDIVVDGGSIVTLENTTGGGSIAFNTLTPDGIIFG